jgi:hypothetical protein
MSERGRPGSYRPENAELARKFCRLGATNQDLADCFEVSVGTIDYWIKTRSEFADGVRRGRVIADASVAQRLFSRAMGYTIETKKHVLYRGEPRELPDFIHYPPDVTACMFWLRNRRPQWWSERRTRLQENGLTVEELGEVSPHAASVNGN